MILYFGLYIFCFTISVCEINKSWIHEQGIFMFVFGSTMQVLAQQQSQCNLLMLLRCNSWGIGLMSFRRLQVLRLQLLIAFKAVMLMQWLYQWYGSILILRSHSSLYSFWRLYLLLLSLCSTAWLDVVGSKRSWILLISGKRNRLSSFLRPSINILVSFFKKKAIVRSYNLLYMNHPSNEILI